MGSGSSRRERAATARVATARVTTARPAVGRSAAAPVDLTQPRPAAVRVQPPEDRELAEEIPDCDLGESLDGEDASRLFSELQSHSAQSTESADSGICDLDGDYGHVITEASAAGRVALVEREFHAPPNLELEVVGRAVPRLLSGYQRSRREERQILQSLRDEGLIATPAERASSGVSFQIVAAPETGAEGARVDSASPAARLPSATLDRLEARRLRHRRPREPETDQLTKQRRRREAEEDKIRKLILRKQQIEQHQQQAEEHRQQRSEDREATMEHRIGSAMVKRQRHLNDLRQRLRDKHDRVKQVPLRGVQVT